ncbi:hypothetical protein BC939DRAFT_461451 [Gamsiella multidivaricata]|uniref:uncharacterized protein n=1 Tax=Gamsiella multidivaricata TaxID=101098 RepID=UPI00221F3D95|nr:uncharacterized protein BC939DRAFT_461451 [Gamsiella multidivaricata]KAG0361597.1 hypothetical protein BGZ54_009041 [Gamsiella multidivaricata]KAI7818921.1 hypothetical protein BC939DRAFT_461451 [Gamsiella multidivaricata]
MGILSLQCVTTNGTRLLGMSYTFPSIEHSNDNNDSDGNNDIVALIQSNPNPTSVSDITWSLVAAYPRPIIDPHDYAPIVCNVDPKTNIFSAMSYFSITDLTYNETQAPRPPGGFQYDPRSNSWSNFTLKAGYQWGDYSATYALFQWPDTANLFQANVGTSNAVHLGMLGVDDNGTKEFINVVSWGLDPNIYGYPSRLVFGNNALYQFGTLVVNNRTGALRNTLTRIPLNGDPFQFKPPPNLPVYNATSMNYCVPSSVSARFYKDILYVFCQGLDNDAFPGQGLLMTFKDGANRDSALSDYIMTDIDRLSGSLIQPIGGSDDGKVEPFAFIASLDYDTMGLALGASTIGISQSVPYSINITDPYGFPLADPPNYTPAIIGGSVAGALVLLSVALFLFIRRRWPRYKRRIRAKIIAMMSVEDDNDGHEDMRNINKIEGPSMDSFDLDGRGKILVTDDMELDGIMDTGTGYMREVMLQQHPRPAIVTTLTADPEDFEAESMKDPTLENRSLPTQTLTLATSQVAPPTTAFMSGSKSMPPLLGLAVIHSPSAPQPYTPGDGSEMSAPVSSASIDQDPPSQRTKVAEATKEAAAQARLSLSSSGAAPPYQQHPAIPSIAAPSFPTPPTPTAPRWISEELRGYRPGSLHTVAEQNSGGGLNDMDSLDGHDGLKRTSTDTTVQHVA